MKRLLLIFFTFLILCGTSNAEYFSDIIVTSPDGIWTDSRTYSTLNDAVAAVGSNKRTIVIANQQVVTSLTVPSNVTLKFERDGSIANSGQLTINTKDIISDNHQIFTGAGNIDFASGSIIKSSWFSNVESAFALTNNDTLTLIISKPQIITASYSPGNNVHLQWEAPGNILTVSAGVTVGNLGKITAGDYQILAGAGDVDFVDGIRLKSCWFDSLRTITTWIESEKVSLAIIGEELVDFDITIQRNIMVDFDSNHGSISISAGVTLYVYQDSLISTIQDPIFTGLGTVAYIYNIQYYIDLAGTDKFTLKLRHIIGLANTDYILLENTTIPSNITLAFEPGARLSPAAGITITAYSSENINAGERQQIFTGAGNIRFSIQTRLSSGWFGAVADGVTDNASYIQAAHDSLQAIGAKSILYIPPGTYKINSGITFDISRVCVEARGVKFDFSSLTAAGVAITVIGTVIPVHYQENMFIEGFELVGNGQTGTGTGLKLNVTGGGGEGAALFSIRSISIHNIGTGLYLGDNSYIVNFNDIGISEFTTGISGNMAGAERLGFTGVTVYNGTISGACVDINGFGDYYFVNSSFDSWHIFDINGGTVNLIGCHIEGPNFAAIPPITLTGNGATFNMIGGMIVTSQGESPVMADYIITVDSSVSNGGALFDSVFMNGVITQTNFFAGGTGANKVRLVNTKGFQNFYHPLFVSELSNTMADGSFESGAVLDATKFADLISLTTDTAPITDRMTGTSLALSISNAYARTGTKSMKLTGGAAGCSADLFIPVRPFEKVAWTLYYKKPGAEIGTFTIGSYWVYVTYDLNGVPILQKQAYATETVASAVFTVDPVDWTVAGIDEMISPTWANYLAVRFNPSAFGPGDIYIDDITVGIR